MVRRGEFAPHRSAETKIQALLRFDRSVRAGLIDRRRQMLGQQLQGMVHRKAEMLGDLPLTCSSPSAA
jgi:hypothetical protein